MVGFLCHICLRLATRHLCISQCLPPCCACTIVQSMNAFMQGLVNTIIALSIGRQGDCFGMLAARCLLLMNCNYTHYMPMLLG